MTSSAMIPKPPGRRSRSRAGQGLRTSIARKATKARRKAAGRGARPSSDTHIPATSPTTTSRGSFSPRLSARRVAATAPRARTVVTAAIWAAAGAEASGQNSSAPTAAPAGPGGGGEGAGAPPGGGGEQGGPTDPPRHKRIITYAAANPSASA